MTRMKSALELRPEFSVGLICLGAYIMKIDLKELPSFFSHLAKNPSLAVALFALFVPIVVLFGATKFVSAPLESLLLFGFLSIAALIYSAWVFSIFNGKSDEKYKNKT